MSDYSERKSLPTEELITAGGQWPWCGDPEPLMKGYMPHSNLQKLFTNIK